MLGDGNSSFSTIVPGLQLAWDSTSLEALKACPRKYYYQVVLGWVPKATSVHLIFGLLYHGALERYDHYRAQGVDHEEALLTATKWTLVQTWNKAKSRPWASDDPNKNRYTLVRSVVWYLDQFGANDPLTTVRLASGKPAVELSFSFALNAATADGEPLFDCGHLDRVATLPDNPEPYIVDRKTTKHTIYPDFFDQYSPHNQFSNYVLAGNVAFGLKVRGLIVDAAQVAVSFTRFVRGPVQRTPDQIEEFYQDTIRWIKTGEAYARAGHWPLNEASCGNYGGCPYRPICAKTPIVREQWLRSNYTQRVWDPLRRRGDI